MKTQHILKSPVGKLYLVANSEGVNGVYWGKTNFPKADLEDGSLASGHLLKTLEQLNEYFEGSRKSFDLKISVEGTEFQKRVWSELSKIPYGKTVSYKDIAAKIKNENACRAVGTANGKNPVSIIVPCHRVIATGGGLGGYAGGLETKTKLLEIERAF